MWCRIYKPNTSSSAQTFDGELVSLPTEMPFTREMFEALRALPHPPELDVPHPEDWDL